MYSSMVPQGRVARESLIADLTDVRLLTVGSGTHKNLKKHHHSISKLTQCESARGSSDAATG